MEVLDATAAQTAQRVAWNRGSPATINFRFATQAAAIQIYRSFRVFPVGVTSAKRLFMAFLMRISIIPSIYDAI
jgi:hypothetical protein